MDARRVWEPSAPAAVPNAVCSGVADERRLWEPKAPPGTGPRMETFERDGVRVSMLREPHQWCVAMSDVVTGEPLHIAMWMVEGTDLFGNTSACDVCIPAGRPMPCFAVRYLEACWRGDDLSPNERGENV